jgi:hypothetical protein
LGGGQGMLMDLGSDLMDHIQTITPAAMQITDVKV